MRHIVLTKNEIAKLTSIQKHGKNMLERNRSMCLLLSNQKHSMSEVARLMNIDRMTVVRLLDAWENSSVDKRFDVLYRVEGQGAKVKLESVRDKIPELLEKHNRTTKLILEDLEKNYNIKVCKITLHTFLKSAGLYL